MTIPVHTMINDIKAAKSLEEVQEIRRKQVEIERAGGDHDGIQRILTEDMYSNPLRFIDELLQNAQDAASKAKKNIDVEFRLYNDKLEFSHSGKEFDLKDVISITGIAVSTKNDKSIGKFGIGFKSVYQITDEPHIYSGKYNFKIVEFRIPISIPQNNNKNTLFILPFKKKYDEENTFSYFKEIEAESLLFLSNINSIEWQGNQKIQQILSLSKVPLEELKDHNLVYKKIEIKNISSEKSKQYLVFHRNIQISGKKLDIDIAFGFDPIENRIIPLINRKLHVYFPTKEETHLNFLLNAPFRPTANRESIKLENSDDFKIVEELSQLYADSILFIKNHFPDLLDVNFYSNLIPLKQEEQNSFYKIFFETIKSLLKDSENSLLPGQNSKFISVKNALLAENLSLMELLNIKDNEQLFSKKDWVNGEITATKEKTKDLHGYLKKHLDVEEIGFEKFAHVFTETFIKKKDDQWITKFYKTLLNNQKRLWEKDPWKLCYWENQTDGVWKKKPIIRLNNDKHVAPYDGEGNPQAWLPSESKSYFDTVKSSLIKDEEAKEFLIKIRLRKPDLLAEFKQYVAPVYEDENPSIEIEQYKQDILKAIEAFREYQNTPDKKNELVSIIESIYFISAQNAATGHKRFVKPGQVYLSTPILKMWFKENSQIYFVDDEIISSLADNKTEFNDFISAINISNNIKFIEPYFKKYKYYCCDSHRYGTYEPKDFNPEFDIEGLSYSLDNINIERSQVIWEIVLIKVKHIVTCKVRSAKFQRSLEGNYDENKPSERPQEKMLESVAGRLLKERHWLFDRQGILLKKPNAEIALEELNDCYDKNHDNVDKLIKALGLKPETYTREQVDEIVFQKEKKIKELEKRLDEYEKKGPKEKPQRDYALDELQLRAVPEPSTIVVKDNGNLGELVNQKPGIGGGSDNNGQENNNTSDDNEGNNSNADKKEYGRWAEEYVVQQLRGKYKDDGDIRIEWLNENAETGKGCDIIIKKNNEAISFIEVKGKVSSKPEFFEVSEMQLKFAGEQGEKYFFYVVSNVKSKEIKIETVIRDPIKEWRENRLIAAHIRFKI